MVVIEFFFENTTWNLDGLKEGCWETFCNTCFLKICILDRERVQSNSRYSFRGVDFLSQRVKEEETPFMGV